MLYFKSRKNGFKMHEKMIGLELKKYWLEIDIFMRLF